MKILYVATVRSHIGQFHMPFINCLIHNGHEVHAAYKDNSAYKKGLCVDGISEVFEIPFERDPLRVNNIRAYCQLRKVIREGDYDIVHCHTPVAAMCTRFACRKLRKNGLSVFYTAHGFHFYKGAPLKNWLLYYPVEWLCAHWTDTLITINKEDYAFAQKHLHAKRVEYIPGVGVDVDKFANAVVDRAEKRREIGVPEDAFLLLSVGELNQNKNHEVVLRALAQIRNKNIHYAIAGNGPLHEYLMNTAIELGISERMHLLGYRRDVQELYKAADVCIHPSLREGLPVALMEGMASGLPCIASRIRGNTDLATAEDILCDPHSVDEFAAAINRFYHELPLKRDAAHIRKFGFEAVNKKMKDIYGIQEEADLQ